MLNRPLAIVTKPDLIQNRCKKSSAGFDTARSASRAHHISLSSRPVIVDLLGFGLPPEIPVSPAGAQKEARAREEQLSPRCSPCCPAGRIRSPRGARRATAERRLWCRRPTSDPLRRPRICLACRPGQSSPSSLRRLCFTGTARCLQQGQGDRSGRSRHSCTAAGAPHAGRYSALQWCLPDRPVSCGIYRKCKCHSQATAGRPSRGRSSPLGTPGCRLFLTLTGRRGGVQGVQYVGRTEAMGGTQSELLDTGVTEAS